MTPTLLAHVRAFCLEHNLLAAGDTVVVGVSGGPDSLALLHLLRALAPELSLKLIVAHLNHRLRGSEADTDAEFVRDVARRWAIEAVIESRDVAALARQRRQSIEEAARQIRYAFLWHVAQRAGRAKIAVGHNADDQAETVLLHFLRGTGLLGLRGILPATPLDQLHLSPADIPAGAETAAPLLIRPLLTTPRLEIEAYCRENGLSPRQDQTNFDTAYARNRLRHELLPYLESFNPNIRQTLARTARIVAAESDLLQRQLQNVWPILAQSESATHVTFDLAAWQQLPLALQRSALRRAIEQIQHGLHDIGFDHIENALNVVESGQTGAQFSLPHSLRLTVSYGSFTLAFENRPPRPDIPQIDGLIWLAVPSETPLPDSPWRVVARLCPPLGDVRPATQWEAFLDAAAVGGQAALRPRRPGDIFCPLGMGGRHKKINEFMIDEKIPAGWRGQIPLLVAGGRVLWVCGYRLDERARVRPETRQVLHLKFVNDHLKKLG